MKPSFRAALAAVSLACAAALSACGCPGDFEGSGIGADPSASGDPRALDLGSFEASVANQTLTLTPSRRMVDRAWPGDTVESHAVTQFVADVPIDVPAPCGISWATLTALTLDGPSAPEAAADGLLFRASIHLHTGARCPDFDVDVRAGTVTLEIAREGDVAIREARVDVTRWSAECDFASWCGGSVPWIAPSVTAMLGATLKTAFASALGGGASAANMGDAPSDLGGDFERRPHRNARP